MKAEVSLDATGITDVGRVRKHNEDSITVDSQIRLYAIADGMGGHMSGDVASQTTLEELHFQINKSMDDSQLATTQEDCYNMIFDAINACNDRILKKNQDNSSTLGTGMGTTLAGIYFLADNANVIVFNVGDSRVYRLRDERFIQMTRDHSMYQDWYDSGQIGEAPARNILSKAIGLMENTLPDLTLEAVRENDVFLICSDGLSNLIDTETIQHYLISHQHVSTHTMCEELIATANENGGNDNISVVIIRTVGRVSNDNDNDNDNDDVTVQRKRD